MNRQRRISFATSAALVATLGLAACGGSPAPAAQSAQSPTTTAATTQAAESPAAPTTTAPAAPAAAGNYVGEEAAKNAALAHAGVAAADARELKAELDNEGQQPHYDVEFKANGLEYDYDIDATTGEVFNYSSEADD